MANQTRGPHRKSAAARKSNMRSRIRVDKMPLPPKPPGDPVQLEPLSDLAQAWWDKEVPKLIEAGLVCPLDSHSLLMMAELWARIETLQTTPAEDPDSRRKQQRELRHLVEMYVKWADKFGMTPASRNRLIPS